MKKQITSAFKAFVLTWLALTFSQQAWSQQSGTNVLSDIQESAIKTTGVRYTKPDRYRTLQLNRDAMQQILSQAPAESPASNRNSNIIFPMPMPDGSISNFRIVETMVMDPALAVQYPQIKTYGGQGIDDPTAIIKLDMTPQGFHAMVLSSKGSFFIDPYIKGNTEHYICYDKKDLKPSNNFVCGVNDEISDLQHILPSSLYAEKSSGTQLRTYRLAMACTGEYATFHGGTVALALAAIVTSTNRVNGVYEKEVAVRLVLVANNNLLVYTNAATDPYSNTSPSSLLSQNQTNCDAVIGSANYDIGHVFSTGGGGLAGLGVVCSNSNKARGETGSSSPIGDAFDIDYVAHEIGHQFGGNHSFNSVTGSCSGNRNANTAYESGSGITIMAYAGICSTDDLAPHSIAYFHTISFDEIVNFTTTGNGNTCAVTTSTGNTAPVVTSMGSAFSIPISTPFVLTGAATDANSDPITYSWEEFDLGPGGAWNVQSTTAPMFMPFSPVTSPSRTFPKLSDIINNTTTVGELLPNQARTLKFRLTVRDNRTGGGGVMHPDTTLNINVVNNGGAFSVTAPNTGVTWAGGSTQSITWNVNGTNNTPINCANVKISLSTDGGNTFPTVITASTANDGTENITVPNIASTQARIKVEAADNIFFDMSNVNFTITASSLSSITTSSITPLSYCAGTTVNVPYTISGSAIAGNVFTAQLSDAAGSFASPVAIGNLTSTVAGTIVATMPSGVTNGTGYRIRVVSSNPVVTGSDNGSNISISAQVFAAGPISGASTVCAGDNSVFYSVPAIPGATSYIWSLPPNCTIQTGNGTSSITVNYSSAATSGSILVAGINGACTGNSSSFAVTVNPLPPIPSAGNVSGCEGTSIALSGTPAGGTFSVANPYTGPSTTYTYTVTNGFGCSATSAAAAITVNPLPAVSFNGLAASYPVTATPATLTGIPAGGTFSGPGISGNTFSPSSAGVGGPYTITYNYTDGNGCSNSESQQTSVVNCSLPSKPGTITTVGGFAKMCPGESRSYTIPAVSGATSYLWTPPAGGVVAAGQGSTTVTIDYTIGFVATDSLKVAAVNACGTGPYRALKITRNVKPAQPGVITGDAFGVCSSSGIPYSVTNVANLTYNWSNSNSNCTVATGQGSSSITADFNSSYLSGTLSVTAINGCGTSTPRNLIIKATPPKPISITGASTVCANQSGVAYSTPVIASASTYTWVAPAGGHVSDGVNTSSGATLVTNATSVTINFGGTSGDVKVRGNNSCGTGSYKTKAITFNCRDNFSNITSVVDLNISPNPNNGNFNISYYSAISEQGTLTLINTVGQEFYKQNWVLNEGVNSKDFSMSNDLSAGIYYLVFTTPGKVIRQKVVKE